jgi:hypothetical protein
MMALKIPRSLRAGAGPVFALGLVGFTCESTPAAGAELIAWRLDFGQALSEAGARGCPVWIQFTGPWCPNCHRMERETFTRSEVAAQARRCFVPVKLRSDIHQELALSYGLTQLPATVIVQPSGAVIARREGFADAGVFQTFLESALRRDGRAAATARPPSEPGVALAGYCPVSLVKDQRLVPGETAVTLEHNGRIYRFANHWLRSLFRKYPERFTPVSGGHCPVAQVDRGEVVVGDPRFGVVYRGHLYLCADKAGRDLFLQDPQRYARVDLADRELCPHCWSPDGLPLRSQPRPPIARSDLHSSLPGLRALQALRPSPTATQR